MDIKGDCGEVSDRNERCAIRPGRKAILIIQWQRTWLNCDLVWNVGFVSDELGYLAGDISKQSIEGMTCFLCSSFLQENAKRERQIEGIIKHKRTRT